MFLGKKPTDMDRRSVLLGGIGIAFGSCSSETDEQTGQKRFALVLANQAYKKNPLPNIDNDAILMTQTLRSLGFIVVTMMNGTRSTMRSKLNELKHNLMTNAGAIGFVYYSGYGVQVDGENFLVPVNNESIISETDVKQNCLSLSYVHKMSKGTKAEAFITVLDACRATPFLIQRTKDQIGLAVVRSELDSCDVVAFAASPRQTTRSVKTDVNSLFTSALATQLRIPNLSLQDVLQRTRSIVRFKSNNKQCPREDNGLEKSIYLNGRSPNLSELTALSSVNQSPTVQLQLFGVPSGAKVTIDGLTISGNLYTADIIDESKSIELVVTALGFKPYVYTVVIPRGCSVSHTVVLERRPKRSNRLSDCPALRAYVDSLRNIPAGTFQRRSSKGDYNLHAKPNHQVKLSSFRMGATPVSVAVWKEYCAATGVELPKPPTWGFLDDHPVVKVSWIDIMGINAKGGFCAWASDVVGFRLTLPTDAQWEYAALGGVSGSVYPWGNEFDRTKLWSSDREFGDAGKTAPVSRKWNIYWNNFGLADMSGNVWQWCSDWFSEYDSLPLTDPIGPIEKSNGSRVIRGGSWSSVRVDYFKCANRDRDPQVFQSSSYGFRLSAGSI